MVRPTHIYVYIYMYMYIICMYVYIYIIYIHMCIIYNRFPITMLRIGTSRGTCVFLSQGCLRNRPMMPSDWRWASLRSPSLGVNGDGSNKQYNKHCYYTITPYDWCMNIHGPCISDFSVSTHGQMGMRIEWGRTTTSAIHYEWGGWTSITRS